MYYWGNKLQICTFVVFLQTRGDTGVVTSVALCTILLLEDEYTKDYACYIHIDAREHVFSACDPCTSVSSQGGTQRARTAPKMNQIICRLATFVCSYTITCSSSLPSSHLCYDLTIDTTIPIDTTSRKDGAGYSRCVCWVWWDGMTLMAFNR